MTSTYTALSPTGPSSAQTGPLFAGTANTNDIALMIGVLTGAMPGFTTAVTTGTGTAEQPQYFIMTNGAFKVRFTNTYGTLGGANGNVTSQLMEWSTDTGSTYATVCTVGYSYDSSGNFVSTTGGGGMMGVLQYLLGKVKTLLSNYNAHAAGTGTAVHGLGSMSTQAATSVAITGGTIKGTPIGSATPTDCAQVFGLGFPNIHSAVTFVTTTMNLDLSTASSFSTTATGSGAQALTVSNPPASGVGYSFELELTNGGLRTWTWMTGTKWAGGSAPTLSTSGKDILTFWTRDGSATWNGSLFGKNFS